MVFRRTSLKKKILWKKNSPCTNNWVNIPFLHLRASCWKGSSYNTPNQYLRLLCSNFRQLEQPSHRNVHLTDGRQSYNIIWPQHLFCNPIKICSTYTDILATHLDDPWTQDVQFRSVLRTRVVVVILGLWSTQKIEFYKAQIF